MLIDYLIDYCDKEFQRKFTEEPCQTCHHPNDKCSGSCDSCLEEIHFPHSHPTGKKEYDCNNLLNYYVCKYSYKYASEILYALNTLESLREFKKFKIMSIGCGATPDLMAFEKYKIMKQLETPLQYIGYDVISLWEPIQNKIKEYCSANDIGVIFVENDAIEYFKKTSVSNSNILILQYIISYFYNNGQISEINNFFDILIKSIISKKDTDEKMIVIINDVNSCYRGRECFKELVQKLNQEKFSGNFKKKYFDYQIKSDFQRYGTVYESCNSGSATLNWTEKIGSCYY